MTPLHKTVTSATNLTIWPGKQGKGLCSWRSCDGCHCQISKHARSSLLIIQTTQPPTHTSSAFDLSCFLFRPYGSSPRQKQPQRDIPHPKKERKTKGKTLLSSAGSSCCCALKHTGWQCTVRLVCADGRNSPGKCWNTFVRGHEVVFEIEVGEVLAVKQLSGQLLQAAARQVDWVHPLGRDLTHWRADRTTWWATCDNVTKFTRRRRSVKLCHHHQLMGVNLNVPLRPSCATADALCRSRSWRSRSDFGDRLSWKPDSGCVSSPPPPAAQNTVQFPTSFP